MEKMWCSATNSVLSQNHSKVRREMGDNHDTTNQMVQDIQTAHDISTHFLTANGYNSDALKVMVKKVK